MKVSLKTTEPFVSVIMPSYNSIKYIRAAVGSVVRQSYVNWELIISDDGSQDGTLRLVQKLSEAEPRIQVLRSAVNQGAAEARNRAISAANGEYIAFLDSDDEWLPDKLAVQISEMQKCGAAFSYTSYECIDESGQRLSIQRATRHLRYRNLLGGSPIGCLTAIYSKRLLGKRYLPNIKGAEDYALWLSILRAGTLAIPIDKVLARYRIRGGSISRNKRRAAGYTWHVLRHVEQLNWLSASWFFIIYAMRGVKKTWLK